MFHQVSKGICDAVLGSFADSNDFAYSLRQHALRLCRKRWFEMSLGYCHRAVA